MLELLAFATLAPATIEEIVVTSSRHDTPLVEHTGNVSALDETVIDAVAHTHIHELLTRVPGVFVMRGSGQESLPSMRSPVLTGAGSCGAFLTLENGIATRPTGFCNVNQLFELPTELAQRIEVIRGPSSALYGSNGLHGMVNVLLPDAGNAGDSLSLELGANDFWRVAADVGFPGDSPVRLGLVHADDGGFREDSGYRQSKAFLAVDLETQGGDLSLWVSASDLDQETAGFIFGEDAYRDDALNRANLNPEAFRNASSQRLGARWQGRVGRFDVDVRPFLRHSDMEFLQHFLPGQPLEENGHVSGGVLTMFRAETDESSLSFGLDIEAADVFLRETQDGPTEGSDFLRETRPEGKHYDYDVDSFALAAFVQTEFSVGDNAVLTAGLRAEHLSYDYVNNMLDGNTRDDGTPCGFGGCLYTRPADRSDSFTDLAPKLGAMWRLGGSAVVYANLARGFRAPQMTELYRLQSGQQVSDLDSETIDSLELGLRTGGDRWSLDGALFAMRKRNSVFRDAEGFNVSGGRSRHEGVELAWDVQLDERWSLAANGTWARHTYDFDVVAARGETFVSGRDVDTAPRWQGSAELRFDPSDRMSAALQWVSLGAYYLDAENQHEYSGHDIANLRVQYALSDILLLTARLNNITDRAIADRADFAFGNYRYFPGRGRELFVQLRLRRDDR
jgi:outer membrane receptor protein involved in Fe transport